jgi:hypothetical protein
MGEPDAAEDLEKMRGRLKDYPFHDCLLLRRREQSIDIVEIPVEKT